MVTKNDSAVVIFKTSKRASPLLMDLKYPANIDRVKITPLKKTGVLKEDKISKKLFFKINKQADKQIILNTAKKNRRGARSMSSSL
ncbi:MAG TPA: hypothetical protein PKN75_10960 [Bacteroidia bacterium]|nr:hypothetical protein [Bacteroidia bacterium]HNU34098.1 hypothetical protein [Bacteroidia bacterium]